MTSDQQIYDGDLVHKTDEYVAMAEDYDFGIAVPHSVKLERHTEYCQWSEFTTQECETCERTTDDGDTESYDCNCVETFHYVKKWRNHRINSLLFDQPANHHNPQRDPFPSAKRRSRRDHDRRTGISPDRWKLSRTAENRSYSRIMVTDPSRRNISAHLGLSSTSPGQRFEARRRAGGTDVLSGHGAELYLYQSRRRMVLSPYEASDRRILRGFGPVPRGSLFDWQLGDLYDMINGCPRRHSRSLRRRGSKDLSVGQMRRAAGQNGV